MAGYGEGRKSPFYADGLFHSSQDIKRDPVVLDLNAVDAANTGATNELRKGLVLAKLTASGKYRQYDNDASDGTEDSANAVILMHPVTMDGTKDNIATVAYEATLSEDALIWKDTDAKNAFDWTAVPRLDRR